MGQTGKIEIRIAGKKGNHQLTPDNFDIKEIIALLSNIEPLIYPIKNTGRPVISYRLEQGSVRNIFTVTKQVELAFAAAMSLVTATGSIDSLELSSAKAVENIQDAARKKDYDFEFRTSESVESLLTVTPSTRYYRSDALWADAELYFYGTLVDAGGKDKSNIHLETKDAGMLVISASKEMLKNEERNLLYKECGVRAAGRQNVETGEIDRSSLHLINIIDYSPEFDETYLRGLIGKVGNKFEDVEVDEYISEIRGTYA